METIYKGITPGTEIVDQQGHSVGKVHEVVCNQSDQLQMVTVQRGLIFKTDVAVPVSAIDRVEGGKIHLCVNKGDLVEMLKPTQEPPAAKPVPDADLHTPAAEQGEARVGTPVIPEIESGVVDPILNTGAPMVDEMHDKDTGAYTHDLGIGTAGSAPLGAGPAHMTTGGLGMLSPAQSEEPTSDDRT